MIHAEGNSAVCQLMWDMQQSCETNAAEQLAANDRYGTQQALVASIPKTYYAQTDRPIIVDKCRSWTLPANMAMIRRYITDKPKVIVLTRQIGEVVESFMSLYERNDFPITAEQLLVAHSEPIMRSNDGVEYAKANNRGEFLFIDYQDLCDYPTEVLTSICTFCEWEAFAHDFDNVVNTRAENDSVYGLVGMHDIRKKVGKL